MKYLKVLGVLSRQVSFDGLLKSKDLPEKGKSKGPGYMGSKQKDRNSIAITEYRAGLQLLGRVESRIEDFSKGATVELEKESSTSGTPADDIEPTGVLLDKTEEARTAARQSSSSSASDRIEGVHIAVGTYLGKGALTGLEAKKSSSNLRSLDSGRPMHAPQRPANEEYKMYESLSKLDEIVSHEAQSITLRGAIYSRDEVKPDSG